MVVAIKDANFVRLFAPFECDNCEANIAEIEPMDVRGMTGMRLAAAAFCPSCSSTTWVLDGTPEALAKMREFLKEEHGVQAKTGHALKP
ncbi:MAG: hypothetical protein PSV26_03060 [Polaromonas sp.]|uniref:hypothetical protein n=1 Tax=Polaromonas sp. TaxID=1869339 RepID=UPI002488A73F|nr:hypothetical protein [Polaromonas sp.]MDI1236446.1 hypothetical protein [Polaromonas sp.]